MVSSHMKKTIVSFKRKMFLKYNKSGGHCYLFLVKSYRNKQRKVQHKNLIYLGRVNNRKDQRKDQSIQKIKEVG